MTRALTTFSLVFCVLFLTACGTSPPVRYYSLQADDHPAYDAKADAVVVGLGPLRVPDYLKRSRMVTRGVGAEMTVHEYARWVEPVDKAMHRVLAADVDGRVDGAVVLAYPFLEPVRLDYLVIGQVERFDSDAAGQVVLQVQWAIVDAAHKAAQPPRRERYAGQASGGGDLEAMARAMSEVLSRFGDDIAGQLRDTIGK